MNMNVSFNKPYTTINNKQKPAFGNADVLAGNIKIFNTALEEFKRYDTCDKRGALNVYAERIKASAPEAIADFMAQMAGIAADEKTKPIVKKTLNAIFPNLEQHLRR